MKKLARCYLKLEKNNLFHNQHCDGCDGYRTACAFYVSCETMEAVRNRFRLSRNRVIPAYNDFVAGIQLASR